MFDNLHSLKHALIYVPDTAGMELTYACLITNTVWKDVLIIVPDTDTAEE